MRANLKIAAFVVATAIAGGAYAQNVTPGTTSPSESGEKPTGGTDANAKTSTSHMKSRAMRSKSQATTPMSTASGASGTTDPNTSTGTAPMKSTSKMKPAKPMTGDTPVKQ